MVKTRKQSAACDISAIAPVLKKAWIAFVGIPSLQGLQGCENGHCEGRRHGDHAAVGDMKRAASTMFSRWVCAQRAKIGRGKAVSNGLLSQPRWSHGWPKNGVICAISCWKTLFAAVSFACLGHLA